MDIAAIVLAAGSSRRMAGPNKLLATMGGQPLVQIAVAAAAASSARPIVVVTGRDAADIQSALAGQPVRFAYNADYDRGLSTSVRTGIAALPRDIAGVVVLLADMPVVDSGIIDRLLAAFAAAHCEKIVAPTANGWRGNPVVWPTALLPALASAEGDRGGRAILDLHADEIVEVECGPAVRVDVDTPNDLSALAAELRLRSPVAAAKPSAAGRAPGHR